MLSQADNHGGQPGMLESIIAETVNKRVYRMTQPRDNTDILRRYGSNEAQMTEMNELLTSRRISDDLQELCDAPFKRKPAFEETGHVTRFSDGSFPVFYSSLEPETVKSEISHWIPKVMGAPKTRRTLYYVLFSCNFTGKAKDLRSKAEEEKWRDLVHENDYNFCNSLGAEAVKTGLKGLLTPSARRTGGTNVPVFCRDAINSPRECAVLAVTYDPLTEEVSMHRI